MTWIQTRLKHVARIGYGLGQPPQISDAGIPILRATNIMRGKLVSPGLIYAAMSDLPLDRAPLLKRGEILVVRSGAYTGDSAIITDEWEGSAPGYDLRVTPTVADPRYLAYCLLGASVLDQIDLAKARAAQPHLNAEDLGDVRILLPPLDEQRRIADFLDAETARIERLLSQRLRQRELLDELTLSLIDEYIGRPGFVPTVRLGYLAFVQTGVTVDSGRQNDGDVVTLPYLRVANVQVGYVDLSEVAEITVPRKTVATSRLQIGDVLMTEGGDLDKLGRGTVWRGEISECLHQNHVFAVRPDLRVIEPEYLALLTRASRARRYFESTGNKTTNLASTSSSKIRDFRVPLPDLPTQRELVKRIDGRLKAVGELNARLFNQIAALAERRQAVITAAVTGRLEVATGRELDGAA
ncbi:restriction endonuclease subunit S [Frankia sp. AgKG'84/4]|uniref:restriction endonuclease subunit S n=1 Tax=Frankia sp. AgKG'84/4 TaxID=573490 RepID=UPI00200F6109|nr:restriction endonuclease subunit S [Frankia sp. AgKG'84/4]MCL9793567.1 restriction endonuclease subunit S [Frankia sp. AgKG'84/4]